MSRAILFIGHGSRDPEGVGELLRLVELCRARRPADIVEHGFLEFAEPTVLGGIQRCLARGATSIQLLPGILLEAGHARRDVPAELQQARRLYPDTEFHLAQHLHLHPRILDLCQLRIEQVLGPARADTYLLVVGRGSSEPAANADVTRLTSLLVARCQLAGGSACYIDLASPTAVEALADCAAAGINRLVVLPFLLFTGTLEKRIRRLVHDFAASHFRPAILYAGHLGAHPLLLDAFLDRAT